MQELIVHIIEHLHEAYIGKPGYSCLKVKHIIAVLTMYFSPAGSMGHTVTMTYLDASRFLHY